MIATTTHLAYDVAHFLLTVADVLVVLALGGYWIDQSLCGRGSIVARILMWAFTTAVVWWPFRTMGWRPLPVALTILLAGFMLVQAAVAVGRRAGIRAERAAVPTETT